MSKDELKGFLTYSTREKLIEENKSDILIYMAFVLLMDVALFLRTEFSPAYLIVWVVPILFTLFIPLFFWLLFMLKQDAVHILIFLKSCTVSMIGFGILFIFYAEFYFGTYSLSLWHIVTAIICIIIVFSAIQYRKNLLYHKKKQPRKLPKHFTLKLGAILAPCILLSRLIRKHLPDSSNDTIYGYVLILLAGIVFLISTLHFYDFIVAKKYKNLLQEPS